MSVCVGWEGGCASFCITKKEKAIQFSIPLNRWKPKREFKTKTAKRLLNKATQTSSGNGIMCQQCKQWMGTKGGEMMDVEDRLESEDERGGRDGEGEQGRDTLTLSRSVTNDGEGQSHSTAERI